jgi:hypothetical protein
MGRDRVLAGEDRDLSTLTDVDILSGTSAGGQAVVEVLEVRIGALRDEARSQPAVRLTAGEFQHLWRHGCDVDGDIRIGGKRQPHRTAVSARAGNVDLAPAVADFLPGEGLGG